jgi:hypothetical protein
MFTLAVHDMLVMQGDKFNFTRFNEFPQHTPRRTSENYETLNNNHEPGTTII